MFFTRKDSDIDSKRHLKHPPWRSLAGDKRKLGRCLKADLGWFRDPVLGFYPIEGLSDCSASYYVHVSGAPRWQPFLWKTTMVWYDGSQKTSQKPNLHKEPKVLAFPCYWSIKSHRSLLDPQLSLSVKVGTWLRWALRLLLGWYSLRLGRLCHVQFELCGLTAFMPSQTLNGIRVAYTTQ